MFLLIFFFRHTFDSCNLLNHPTANSDANCYCTFSSLNSTPFSSSAFSEQNLFQQKFQSKTSCNHFDWTPVSFESKDVQLTTFVGFIFYVICFLFWYILL
jgi:hypothetical protein